MRERGFTLARNSGDRIYNVDEREILYVIAERLQLAELKELIYREDPTAFIAIENLHEVANGNQGGHGKRKTRIERLISRVLGAGAE